MPIIIRMAMMAITISNSINVKPFADRATTPGSVRCLPRLPRPFKNVRFMGFQCLVVRVQSIEPIRQNATTDGREREMERSEKQWTAGSGQ